MERRLNGNIWKYIVFSITSARIYMPVVTLYLLSFEAVEYQTAGIILAVVQLSQFVFEVPSGYLSDRIGHKPALILTRVFFLLSSICFLIGGITFFYIGAVWFGLGLAFASGTLTAFMQETLQALGKMNQYSKIIGRAQSIYLVISAVLLIGIPATFALHIKLPFLITLMFDIVGLAIAISFTTPPTENIKTRLLDRNFSSLLTEAKNTRIILLTIFISLLIGIVLGTRVFQDAYQVFVGVPVIYLGVFFAASKLVSAVIMRTPIYNLKDRLSFKQFASILTALLLSIIMLLGLTENSYIIASAFIFAAGLLWGAMPTLVHYKLDRIGSSQYKASLLSLGGLADSLFLAATSFGIGVLVHNHGFTNGYLYYTCVSVGLLLCVLPLLPRRKPSQT